MGSIGTLRRFVREEQGQGLVEYALILFLIAVVVVAALGSLGKRTNNVMSNVGDTFDNGKGVCGTPPCGKGGGKGPG